MVFRFMKNCKGKLYKLIFSRFYTMTKSDCLHCA